MFLWGTARQFSVQPGFPSGTIRMHTAAPVVQKYCNRGDVGVRVCLP